MIKENEDMKKVTISGFESEYYVVVETDEYMILREVQTKKNKETWEDFWTVISTSDNNWDKFKKSYLYVHAESFELALACASGISLANGEYKNANQITDELSLSKARDVS